MTVKNLLTNLLNNKIDDVKEVVIIFDETNNLLVCDELEKMAYSVVREMNNYNLIDLHINANEDTTIYVIKGEKEVNE